MPMTKDSMWKGYNDSLPNTSGGHDEYAKPIDPSGKDGTSLDWRGEPCSLEQMKPPSNSKKSDY